MVGSATVSPSLLDYVAGDLVLRVCSSSRHGQTVRLRSAKCSIGSERHCTLRLRARGIRPVHCLIVRGSGGTFVRRWAPDTRLNGQTFSDAALRPGDRLAVGAIELEVLETGEPAQGTQAASSEPSTPQTTLAATSDRQRHDRPLARLRRSNQQNRQRVRKLIEQLRSARKELGTRLHNQDQSPQVSSDAMAEAQQQSQKSSGDAPVDLASVLLRFGAEPGLFDAAADEGPSQRPAPEPGAAPRCPESPTPAADGGSEAEESIDDYMARLMQRLNSASAAPEYREDQMGRGSAHTPNQSESASDAPADSTRMSKPALAARREPAAMAPRAVAAERRGGLTAMRELANLSAHAALNQYTRQKVTLVKRAKLAVAMAGLLAGGLLIWMWSSHRAEGMTYFYAALVAFLVTVVWGIEYALLTGRLAFSETGCLVWKPAGARSRAEAAETPRREAAASPNPERTDGGRTDPPAIV